MFYPVCCAAQALPPRGARALDISGLLHTFWQREYFASWVEAEKESLKMGELLSVTNEVSSAHFSQLRMGAVEEFVDRNLFKGRTIGRTQAMGARKYNKPPQPAAKSSLGPLKGHLVSVNSETLRGGSTNIFPVIVASSSGHVWGRHEAVPAMASAFDAMEGGEHMESTGSFSQLKFGRKLVNQRVIGVPERFDVINFNAELQTELDNSHQRGGVRNWVNDKLSSLFSDVEKFPEFLASGMRSSLQHLGKGWDKHFGEPVFIVCGDRKVYQEEYRVFHSATKLFGDLKKINEMNDNEKRQKGIPTGVNFSEVAVNEKNGATRSIINFKPDFLDESDVWIIGWVEETGGWAR